MPATLCQILMADRHDTRSIAFHRNYHELLLESLTTHAANVGVVEACLSGLKRLSFQSTQVQEELAKTKPFTRLCGVLCRYRETSGVMAVGLSLLCNLARSVECSSGLLESRLVSLAVSSLLQLQGNADVVKYGAWMLCNILSHKATPHNQVEEVSKASGSDEK